MCWIYISSLIHAGEGRLRVILESCMSLLGVTWLLGRSKKPNVSFERIYRRYFAIPNIATSGFIAEAVAMQIEEYKFI
jgi:hypothetical protein